MTVKTRTTDIKEIFHLFYQFPLKEIPLINDKMIKGYLVKDEILKRANNSDFFNSSILLHLNSIINFTEDHNDFFTEIEKQNLKQIPALHSELLNIEIYPTEVFCNKFNPLDRIFNDDYSTILNHINLPLLIVNSVNTIIYYNKRFTELKFFFGIEEDILLQPLHLYFKNSINKNIDTFDEKNEYHLKYNDYKVKYRIQLLKLAYGTVYLIVFS